MRLRRSGQAEVWRRPSRRIEVDFVPPVVLLVVQFALDLVNVVNVDDE